MVKFNIKDGKLIVDPSTLTVAAFKAIWDYDKSETKENACNMLCYVFHMADITSDNPFVSTPESDREAVCKQNDFGSRDHKFTKGEAELIDHAIEWYSYLNRDSVRRLSITLDKKIDELNKYLDEHPIESAQAFKDQVKVLKDIDIILSKKEKVEAIISKQTVKTKAQGDLFRSPREKRMIGLGKKTKK